MMKRNLLGLAVLSLVFVGHMTTAHAQQASGHGATTFDENGNEYTVTFGAVKNQQGRVNGQIEARNLTQGWRIHGVIECLVVQGNQAVMLGTVTQSSDPDDHHLSVGLAFLLLVEDNGEGANAEPDGVSLLGFGTPYTSPDLTEGGFEQLEGWIRTVDAFCGLAEDGFFFPIQENPFLPILPNQNGNIQVKQ